MTKKILTDWLDNLFAFEACARLAEDSGKLSVLRIGPVMGSNIEGKFCILPSLIDFIIDFENAARAVLTEPQFVLFKAVFIKHTVKEAVLPDKILHMISDAVGAEVLRRKIYHQGYFYQHSASIQKEAEERAREQRIAAARLRRTIRAKKAA
jgi:hypothetical protein